MIALIAALFGGLSVRAWLTLAGGAAIIVLVLVVSAGLIDRGRTRALDDITKANDKALSAADRAEQAYRACVASGKEPVQCVK